MIIIEDTPVADDDPFRANNSIPNFLKIDKSPIPNAGTGVFTKQPVQKDVRFGPYQGAVVLDEEDAHKSGYAWEVGILILSPPVPMQEGSYYVSLSVCLWRKFIRKKSYFLKF